MAAKDLTFGIKIDTKQAEQSTKKLSESLEKTSKQFDKLQKEVDQTQASINQFQKSVSFFDRAQRKVVTTNNLTFKAVENTNKAYLKTDKILAKNNELLKTNSERFKDLEASAEGARAGLTLFGEVILGIPGDIVTKLFDAFDTLGAVIKKGFANAVTVAGAVVKKFIVLLKNLTIAIITNPLFIKAAIIVAGIVAVVVALKDLEERFGLVSEVLDSVAALFGFFEEDTRRTATTLEVLGRTVKNVGIILLSGFLTPILLVLNGLLRLKKAITTDEEALFQLEGQIAALESQMANFADATGQAFEELNPFTAAANIAAEKTKKLNEELKKSRKELEGTIKATNLSVFEVETFGDEFQKLSLAMQNNRKAVKEQQDQMAKGKGGIETIKKMVAASEELGKNQVRLKKISQDAFTTIAEDAKKSEIELLKAQGQNAKARQMENEATLKGLDELFAKVIAFGNLGEEQKKQLIKNQSIIRKNTEERLALLDKEARKAEEAAEAKKKADEQRAAIEKGGEVSDILAGAGDIASGLGGEMFGGISEALTGAAAEFGLSAAASFITAVLAIPDALKGAAGFLDKITDIGPNIADALKSFTTALVRLVAEFIPNLINSLGDILDTLITDLLIKLPDAFIALSEAIPEALAQLVERLPDLIQNFIQGMITRGPKLLIAWANLFIKMLIKFVPRLVQALPDIGEAIILGVIEGILEIADLISKLFSGESLVAEAANIGEAVGEGLKASSSEVFQVIDLEQQRLGKDAGQFITDATQRSINLWRKFWEFIFGLWDKFVKFLQDVWDGIIGAISDVFTFISDKILRPVFDVVADIFQFIGDKIFQPFIDALKAAGKFFSDVFSVFIDGFTAVWDFVDKNIISPFAQVLQGVEKIFAAILNPIIDIFNAMKIGPVRWEISAGKLGSASGTLIPEIDFIPGDIKRLQEGGLVTGPGQGDVIPAFLEPGEFVLNKDAVAGIGINNLTAMNQGQQMEAGGATINYAPTINVSGQNFDPREVVEQMFTELRRRSSNGTKVIFAQGIKS